MAELNEQELDKILKILQQYAIDCTLANLEYARADDQWEIHNPNRKEVIRAILALHQTAVEQKLQQVAEELGVHEEDSYGDIPVTRVREVLNKAQLKSANWIGPNAVKIYDHNVTKNSKSDKEGLDDNI